MPSNDSRCSCGTPVTYRWHEAPDSDQEATIKLVVQYLMTLLDGPDRLQNPYRSADARQGFTDYLRRATKGRLTPVEEVKYIAKGGPDAPLYEIRWNDVKVVERNPEGPPSLLTACVRLYHAEPATLPLAVVGLHGHEKILEGDDDEVWEAQDREIDCAYVEFLSLANHDWPGF